MNGYKSNKKYIDKIDMSSMEYMRPAEIKQDVRQMSERKRVNEILKSRQFREDLEKVVVDKINITPQDKVSLKVLQQLSELPPSQAKLKHGPIFARSGEDLPPICDVEGKCNTPQKILSCKLACCCRILNQATSFVSAKLEDGSCLVSTNVAPSHTSASSFQHINAGQDGAYRLHTATYLSRPDLACLIHLTHPEALEVSSSDLLPLSRQAVLVGEVAKLESAEAISPFQQPSKVALLNGGGGFLVAGSSVAEALSIARRLNQALSIQVKASRVGLENVELLSENAQRRILKGMPSASKSEVEFETLLRKLEHQGQVTGLRVREVGRVEKGHFNSDVELPPTVVAMSFPDQERPVCTKQASFTEYLNSPMAYKKEQVDMAAGTPYQKTITKWVPESSPSGTSIKIDNANQFVPLNTDPAELKQAVKMIRKEYYDEKITAGPNSKVLEGPSWEEAQKLRESNKGSETVVMVGAASQGIVQKGHQNQGTLYKTYYAPNPFDNVSAEEVEAYQQQFEDKRPGSTSRYLDDSSGALEPGPDGELVSTEERLQQFKQQQEAEEARDVFSQQQQQLHHPQQHHQHPQQHHQQQHHQQPHQQHQQLLLKAPPPQQAPHSIEPPQLYQQQSPQSSLLAPFSKVATPASPCKSASSAEGVTNEVFSGNEVGGGDAGGDSEKKKKKKRGFKMPSFSKKKDKK